MKEPISPALVQRQRPAGRLWGLDVITVAYALGAVLCVYLVFAGPRLAKLTGLMGAPICVIACLGVAYRVNTVRLALIVFLIMVLLLDVVDMGLATLQKTPLDVPRLVVQIVLTFLLLGYLLRRDVRDAFLHKSAG